MEKFSDGPLLGSKPTLESILVGCWVRVMSPNPKKEGGRERGRRGGRVRDHPKPRHRSRRRKRELKSWRSVAAVKYGRRASVTIFLQRAGVPGAPKCTNVIYDTKLANKPTVHMGFRGVVVITSV